MIALVWSVLCSRPIVDGETNNISLIDVVEEAHIQTAGLPGALPIQLTLVSLWAREHPDQPERARGFIQFCDPAGAVQGDISSEIDLTAHTRFRQIVRFVGLPISTVGVHWFNVFVEIEQAGAVTRNQVARIPLDVILHEAAE